MNYLRQLFTRLRSGISRYSIAFYGSCVLFVITAVFIYADSDENLFIRLILSVFLAMVLSVTLQTMSDKYDRFRFNYFHLVHIIISVASAAACFGLLNDIDNVYTAVGYAGVLAALAAAALYFLFSADNINTVIPFLFKNMILAGFIGLVFFGGITLCIYAVNYLIYEFDYDVIGRLILTALAFAYEVLALNIFLSGLPNAGEELHIPGVFKILVLYVAFPIYLLLMAVLYVYLGKILITLNMPGGQINLFASFAALFFIFFRFTIIQYDYPITRIFARFGGLIMLPVLAAQAVAVYIRLNAYGLTSARYLSVVLNIIVLIFVVLSLIKRGKYISRIIIVFIAAVLPVSVTPLNLIDVPVYEQTLRLDRVLAKNNMFSDGSIIPNAEISEVDKATIRSCYNYLIFHDNAPYYIKNIKSDTAFGDIFGFNPDFGYADNLRYYNFHGQASQFDISGYARLVEINESSYTAGGRFIVTVENAEYDLTGFVLTLSEDDTEIIYSPADNITLIFKTVDYSVDHDNIFQYYYISGYALIK